MMKSRLEGASFSYSQAYLIYASFSMNCVLEYLLKQRVVTHVFRSRGSTSRFLEAMNRADTAVSCKSLDGRL